MLRAAGSTLVPRPADDTVVVRRPGTGDPEVTYRGAIRASLDLAAPP
jgi:hypothetical protein